MIELFGTDGVVLEELVRGAANGTGYALAKAAVAGVLVWAARRWAKGKQDGMGGG